MRLSSLIILFVAGQLPAPSIAQQSAKSFRYNDDRTLGYLEYLPPGYDTATTRYPVLLYLHGGGEGGDGSPEQLEKVLSWGPPKLISQGHDMCFTVGGKKECFIVISPQIVTQIHDWPFFVPFVIDHILNGPDAYKADPDRIYLTGLSRGGNGVYGFAGSHLNVPNKLAAIAPIAAWADSFYDGCIISGAEIPVWAFHGRKDTIVPYAQGTIAFNGVKYCANPEPVAELIFTTYEDRYHDSWIPAYDPSHDYHEPNLYEWLLLHTRREPQIITAVGEGRSAPLGFSIYPNPATSDIFVYYQGHPYSSPTITIRDITGTPIAETDYRSGWIDISGLTPGMYVLQMISPSGAIATERLIKLQH